MLFSNQTATFRFQNREPVAPKIMVWGDAFCCTEVVADLVPKQIVRPHLPEKITNLTIIIGCKDSQKMLPGI